MKATLGQRMPRRVDLRPSARSMAKGKAPTTAAREKQCDRQAAPLLHRHKGKAREPAAQQKHRDRDRAEPGKTEAAAPKSRDEGDREA